MLEVTSGRSCESRVVGRHGEFLVPSGYHGPKGELWYARMLFER